MVAIKKQKKYEIIKNKQVDHVRNELMLISNMVNDFLVKLEGFTHDDSFIYLVMEFI